MASHSFSLDPRTVLGIGPSATLDEIREAYRAKSKKHHPDLGGDEWAFRMVLRAYEVLKTTVGCALDFPYRTTEPVEKAPAHNPAESWGARLDDFRVVQAELMWIRFDAEEVTQLEPSADENDATLSVCLVVSWPAAHLVDRTAEYDSAAATLRVLVDLFDLLRGSDQVSAGRSRIEDGRFVGWLSYPNVFTAQDAFVVLRHTLREHQLSVQLQTTDERIPLAWQRVDQEPMNHAEHLNNNVAV